MHVRVMGALAVGKTSFVTMAISRSVVSTYVKSRYNQRFVTSVKSPKGTHVMIELIDSKGNESLENLVAEDASKSPEDERKALLSRDEIEWCYLIIFDYTRHETYLHAKKLVEDIRVRDYSASNSRKTRESIVFLLGNKRDLCVAPSLTSWIRDLQKFGKEKRLFIFSGSAKESNFEALSKQDFVYPAVGLRFQGDSALQARLNIEKLLYVFKARQDYELGRGEYDQKVRFTDIEKDDDKLYDDDDDKSKKDQGNCANCWNCCGRRKKSTTT